MIKFWSGARKTSLFVKRKEVGNKNALKLWLKPSERIRQLYLTIQGRTLLVMIWQSYISDLP